MIIFGDSSTFGISYRPDNKAVKGNYAFSYCHFIFKKELIGLKRENCFLGTWAISLLDTKKKILLKEGCLTEPEFSGLSEIEIFEILLKANQSEEDFKENYKYLPKLEEDVWYKYRVDMDETIDRYTIFVIENENMLKFLWRNHVNKNSKLGIMTTTHEQFYNTVDLCLSFLTKEYPSVLRNLS
jgi:hypothetical protein